MRGNKYINYVGWVQGDLEAIAEVPSEHYNKLMLFKCKCGEEFVQSLHYVRSTNKQSCGCKKGRKGKQNGKPTKLYNTWIEMRRRCRDPKRPEWKYYGGKGVKVCDEWEDYEIFEKWAFTVGWSDIQNPTIERVDTNGDYCPQNCFFIPAKKQIRNRDVTVLNERLVAIIRGVAIKYPKLRLTVIAELVGVNVNTIYSVVNGNTWKEVEPDLHIESKRHSHYINTN